jgi:predicted nuclease with TOPRIM domain
MTEPQRNDELSRLRRDLRRADEECERLEARLNERADQVEAAEDLGSRAARLVAQMLHEAGRYLTGNFQEINDVLIEARQRKWLED